MKTKTRFWAMVLGVCLTASPGDAPASGSEPAWGVERKVVTLGNGLRMGYVELGDPGKPTLVFLHGFTNSSLGYLPLGRLLAQRYHVFLLDQRGHGVSDKPECCYTRLDMAYDVKLFLDLKGIQRAHIAGHSMGGMGAVLRCVLAGAGRSPDDHRFEPGTAQPALSRRAEAAARAEGLGRRGAQAPGPDRPGLAVHAGLVERAGRR